MESPARNAMRNVLVRRVLVTVTGPSCAGKTTLLAKLVSTCDNMSIVPTYTTRPLRDDDIHYVQVTEDEFKEAEKNGEFAEHVYFDEHFYGTKFTSMESIWRDGHIALKAIEPIGVASFEHLESIFNFDLVKIWLGTSKEVIKERLKNSDRQRDLNKELNWYKRVRWHLVVKHLTDPDKLANDIVRMIPSFVRYKNTRIWR